MSPWAPGHARRHAAWALRPDTASDLLECFFSFHLFPFVSILNVTRRHRLLYISRENHCRAKVQQLDAPWESSHTKMLHKLAPIRSMRHLKNIEVIFGGGHDRRENHGKARTPQLKTEWLWGRQQLSRHYQGQGPPDNKHIYQVTLAPPFHKVITGVTKRRLQSKGHSMELQCLSRQRINWFWSIETPFIHPPKKICIQLHKIHNQRKFRNLTSDYTESCCWRSVHQEMWSRRCDTAEMWDMRIWQVGSARKAAFFHSFVASPARKVRS